jgi:hypothetical protein
MFLYGMDKSGISLWNSPENLVEADFFQAAEVQAVMETRSAQVFSGQKFGVEAHVEDNWAGGDNAGPKHQ